MLAALVLPAFEIVFFWHGAPFSLQT